MRNIILAAVIAAAASVSGASTNAMPLVQIPADGGIVQVAGGCGPDGHRGPDGRCYPNRPMFRRCPPRMHLDRFGHCRWN